MNPAAATARRKERYPDLYCPHARCLWMTGGGLCPRHGGPTWTPERQARANMESRLVTDGAASVRWDAVKAALAAGRRLDAVIKARLLVKAAVVSGDEYGMPDELVAPLRQALQDLDLWRRGLWELWPADKSDLCGSGEPRARLSEDVLG